MQYFCLSVQKLVDAAQVRAGNETKLPQLVRFFFRLEFSRERTNTNRPARTRMRNRLSLETNSDERAGAS